MLDAEIGRDGGPNWEVDERGCWVWLRYKRPHGYGMLRRDGRSYTAHRFIFEQVKGPIPEGLDLDHLCRNRACVNPEHVEPVTRAVNARRGARAKLGPLAVRGIRASKRSGLELARMFNVSPSVIYDCRRGRTYPDG